MDLLWGLLTLPYAPVRGLTAVVQVIAREAETKRCDPITVRRELEELDEAARSGELTGPERDRAQQRVLDRLTGTGGGVAATADRPTRRPAGTRRRPVRRGSDHEQRHGR